MRIALTAYVIVGLACSAARATPMVTYTLSLNESPTGTVAAGQFAVYATVSREDNAGLFAFGVDLLGSGQVGGPTNLALINRSPNGEYHPDPTNPNYDPLYDYPKGWAGFGTGRGAVASSGIVSGVQDLCKCGPEDIIRVYGAGQVVHSMDDFRPPPGDWNGVPMNFVYVPQAGTDTPFGNPYNRAGAVLLPEGSLRLATGIYDVGGAIPTFELASINNKASVWKVNHPTGTENELAMVSVCLRDYSGAQVMEIVPGQSCVAVPEPSLAGMLLLIGILIHRKRRRQ